MQGLPSVPSMQRSGRACFVMQRWPWARVQGSCTMSQCTVAGEFWGEWAVPEQPPAPSASLAEPALDVVLDSGPQPPGWRLAVAAGLLLQLQLLQLQPAAGRHPRCPCVAGSGALRALPAPCAAAPAPAAAAAEAPMPAQLAKLATHTDGRTEVQLRCGSVSPPECQVVSLLRGRCDMGAPKCMGTLQSMS